VSNTTTPRSQTITPPSASVCKYLHVAQMRATVHLKFFGGCNLRVMGSSCSMYCNDGYGYPNTTGNQSRSTIGRAGGVTGAGIVTTGGSAGGIGGIVPSVAATGRRAGSTSKKAAPMIAERIMGTPAARARYLAQRTNHDTSRPWS
jgi:hypothetical protein